MKPIGRSCAAAVALLCIATAAPAETARPENLLAAIDVAQQLGKPLPLDAAVVDSDGRALELGDVFSDRPAVLAFVYYDCPMLCSLVLEGLVKSLRPLRLDVGRDFDVVVLSFDPGESPQQAAAAKRRYVDSYDREGSEAGWHFLTAGADSIERLTAAAGFRYAYDENRDEYAHAATIMVTTADGRLARYFFGVEYPPRDVKLALVEASDGSIGSVTEQLLLYCYHYDPSAGRYTAAVMNIVRLAGAATVAGMLTVFVVFRRRERSSC
jgi:protein SCO1/2